MCVAVCVVFSFFSVCTNAQTDEIRVYIDGVELKTDVKAQIINSRTMVPVRAIFEHLGAEVTWVDEIKTVIATKGPHIINMKIDKQAFLITDIEAGQTRQIPLDVPAQIVNSRTLVPVRAISEALNKKVEWIEEERKVLIVSESDS